MQNRKVMREGDPGEFHLRKHIIELCKKEKNWREISERRKGEGGAMTWISREGRHLEGWGMVLRGDCTEVIKE